VSEKRKIYTKAALTLSMCLLILWALLGMGTTLAWFADDSQPVRNEFYFGVLDADVFYMHNGGWTELDGSTKVFDDQALYEPGYTQVVYLKVKNNGTVPFTYRFAVDVESAVISTSVLGNRIYRPDYLNFGVIFGADQAELDRRLAAAAANKTFGSEPAVYPLNTFSEKDSVVVPEGGERHIALIVRMPEETGNEANYRGDTIPEVQLGLKVTASQVENPDL